MVFTAIYIKKFYSSSYSSVVYCISTTFTFGFLALATVYGTFIVGLANMGLLYSFEKNYFKYEISSKK